MQLPLLQQQRQQQQQQLQQSYRDTRAASLVINNNFLYLFTIKFKVNKCVCQFRFRFDLQICGWDMVKERGGGRVEGRSGSAGSPLFSCWTTFLLFAHTTCKTKKSGNYKMPPAGPQQPLHPPCWSPLKILFICQKFIHVSNVCIFFFLSFCFVIVGHIKLFLVKE